MIALPQILSELSSAEDFLLHFDIEHDPKIVAVHRVELLRRVRCGLAAAPDSQDPESALVLCRTLLERAYSELAKPGEHRRTPPPRRQPFVALGSVKPPHRRRPL